MVRIEDIRRLPLGTFVRPGEETVDGRPRAEAVLGYLVPHPAGQLLLDTGIGAADEDTESHYRPVRRPLQQALAEAGTSLDDIAVVVNCHLHFDHCGGNPLLAGRPVFAQRGELALARAPGHTFAELVDFPGVTYEEIDGEAEILPGVHLLATPGHTTGHQSLAVECADGTVVLAGQAHDYASDHTAAALARQARLDGVADPLPAYPPWMDRIAALDPRRVLFAHDLAVWEPATLGR